MTPAQVARARDTAPSSAPGEYLAELERIFERLHPEEGTLIDTASIAVQVKAIVDELHPADIAHVLEGLPLEDRLLVWGLVGPDREGEVLLETADAVRETLLADMDDAEIVAAASELEPDEVADLAPDLSDEVVQDILEARGVDDRAQLQAALSYPEGTVGSLMDFEAANIREDALVENALQILCKYDELSAQTDSLFVVDRFGRLRWSNAALMLLHCCARALAAPRPVGWTPDLACAWPSPSPARSPFPSADRTAQHARC